MGCLGKLFRRNTTKSILILDNKEQKSTDNNIEIMDFPRICALGFDNEKLKAINSYNNIYYGSLGDDIIDIKHKYSAYDFQLLKPEYDIPENLHEYQIIGIDLNKTHEKSFSNSEAEQNRIVSPEEYYFIVKSPQNVFCNKNYSLHLKGKQILDMKTRKSILVIFASSKKMYTYKIGSLKNGNVTLINEEEIGIYENLPSIYLETQIYGKFQKIINENKILKPFLEKYLNSFIYHTTFYHPSENYSEKCVKDTSFFPLLTTEEGKITSYIKLNGENVVIVLPSSSNSEDIFIELIQTILPQLFPELFPSSQLFSWVEDEMYYLPNHMNLVEQKMQLMEMYTKKIHEIEELIELNKQEYSFLHKLLTSTGDELVASVKMFLEWLEFEDVLISDEHKTEDDLLEEDITFSFNQTKFLVEVKGLAGTSKDSDCSQIVKIVHRRMRETHQTNFKGIYIVNHERFKPPVTRRNPPFSEEQIKDAENCGTLMLTTWDLFNCYINVKYNYMTKKWMRDKFFNNGFDSLFLDKELYVGEVKKTYKENTVGVVIISKVVSKNLKILASRNHELFEVEIIEIRQNDIEIETTETIDAEYTFLFSKEIPRRAKLYKRPE